MTFPNSSGHQHSNTRFEWLAIAFLSISALIQVYFLSQAEHRLSLYTSANQRGTAAPATPNSTSNQVTVAPAPENEDHRKSPPKALVARLSKALADEKFRSLLTTLQHEDNAKRYSTLLAQLSLSPLDRDRLLALIGEKQLAKSDALGAAIQIGAIGTPAVEIALENAQKPIQNQILALLGQGGYQEYSKFESTNGLRDTLKRLQASLQYSDSPLSDQQIEAAVTTLNEALPDGIRNLPSRQTGLTADVAVGLTPQSATAQLPKNSTDLLRNQLSEGQLAELESLMQKQADESHLASAMMSRVRAANTAALR